MTKSILITGAGGQLGSELVRAPIEHERVGLLRKQLDITEFDKIEKMIELYQPSIVINAAAYTQVDQAEHEPELVFATNRDGLGNLARACNAADIPLLHVSTDYIFDGTKQGSYDESDEASPLSVYGESKAAGDEALRAAHDKHIILRTSWLFGAYGNNFVKTMLRLGRERDELGIVDDQHGCPTSARSLADAQLQIADQYLQGKTIEWGTYNCCNQPDTTWYRFAKEIFRQAGGYENLKLNAITADEYPTPAKRPKNSILNCARLNAAFGIEQVNWEDELKLVI